MKTLTLESYIYSQTESKTFRPNYQYVFDISVEMLFIIFALLNDFLNSIMKKTVIEAGGRGWVII
jgi:hypothetical protein